MQKQSSNWKEIKYPRYGEVYVETFLLKSLHIQGIISSRRRRRVGTTTARSARGKAT